jgi:hypothetical protein
MSTRLARKKPSTQKPRRAPKSSVYTVFISHSSHDLWIANQIAKLVKGVAFEIGAVAVQRKRVTPVLNNVSLEAMAPMKGVKAIDLNEFDDFLGQLKGRINRRKHGKK